MEAIKLEEKLNLIATILGLRVQEMEETTELIGLQNWDSLTMLNMQIEFMMYKENIELSQIKECCTVADLCKLL